MDWFVCILCLRYVDGVAKPEHILLNALGGRKTSSKLICNSCNEKTGSSIDQDLADSIATIRNIAGFPKGNRKSAPSLNVDTEHGKVRFDSGLKPILNSQKIVIENDGSEQKTVAVRANDYEELSKLVPHISKITNKNESDIWEELNSSGEYIFIPIGMQRFQLSFGAFGSQQSMAKACLELWAVCTQNTEVTKGSYDSIREFINKGGKSNNFSSILNPTDDLGVFRKCGYSYFPNIISVYSNKKGVVYGEFIIYGMIGWRFILGDTIECQECFAVLISNPFDPSKWALKTHKELDTSFAFLKETFQIDEVKNKFSTLLREIQSQKREELIEWAFSEAAERIGISEKDPIPSNRYFEFIGIVSYILSNSLMGVPFKLELRKNDIPP